MGVTLGGWVCSAHVPVVQLIEMATEADREYELPQCKRPKPCEEGASVTNGSAGQWYEERCKVMEELEASLPPGLSKNQRKKQLRLMYRNAMKDSWRYVDRASSLLLTVLLMKGTCRLYRKQKKEKEKEKKRKLEKDDSQRAATGRCEELFLTLLLPTYPLHCHLHMPPTF